MKPIMKLYRPSWNIYGIKIDRYNNGVLEDYCEKAVNKKMKEKYPSFLERIIHLSQKKEINKDVWNRMKKIISLNGLERMYNERIEEFFSVYSNKKEDLKKKTKNLHHDFKEVFNVELKTDMEYI